MHIRASSKKERRGLYSCKAGSMSRTGAGFTIVELLVVIVVIAVLASIVIVTYSGVSQRANETKLQSDLASINRQIEAYRASHGSYPADLAAAGIALGQGSSLQYSVDNSTSTPTFCVTDTTGGLDWHVSNGQTPASGACAGHVTGDASCTNGYTKNGSTCTLTYQATYSAGATSYTCPSGGSLSGTTCTLTYGATYVSGGYGAYYCPSGGTLINTNTCEIIIPVEYYDCPDAGGEFSPPYTPTSQGGRCYKDYTASRDPLPGSYTCPTGGTLSGSTCTYVYTATSSTSEGAYSCPDGGTLSGSTCTKTYSLAG